MAKLGVPEGKCRLSSPVSTGSALSSPGGGQLVVRGPARGVVGKTTGGLRGELAGVTAGGSSPERRLAAKKAGAMHLAVRSDRVDSAETMARGALDVHLLVDASGSAMEIKPALVAVAERLGTDLSGDNPLLRISYGAFGGDSNITVGGDVDALNQANVATDDWDSSLNEALGKLRERSQEARNDSRLGVIITFNDAMPSKGRNGADLDRLIAAYNREDTVHIVCYVPSAGSNEHDYRKLKDLCSPELGLRHAHFFDFSDVDISNPEVVSRFLTDIIDVVKASNPRVPSNSEIGEKNSGVSGISVGTRRSVLMEQVKGRLLTPAGSQGPLLLTTT